MLENTVLCLKIRVMMDKQKQTSIPPSFGVKTALNLRIGKKTQRSRSGEKSPSVGTNL